jgi:hypothetical protein
LSFFFRTRAPFHVQPIVRLNPPADLDVAETLARQFVDLQGILPTKAVAARSINLFEKYDDCPATPEAPKSAKQRDPAQMTKGGKPHDLV